MGVLPLQFMEGSGHESLGLTGEETYELCGLQEAVTSSKPIHATALKANGKAIKFELRARIDTLQEAEYYRNGGILLYVLRQLIASTSAAA
jgi:aconitate hydratase